MREHVPLSAALLDGTQKTKQKKIISRRLLFWLS
jgi:hypothetical protein